MCFPFFHFPMILIKTNDDSQMEGVLVLFSDSFEVQMGLALHRRKTEGSSYRVEYLGYDANCANAGLR